MTARWNLLQLATACQGELTGGGNTPIDHVWTDTRQTVTQGLFVALQGPRFDGHDHLAAAQAAGAVAAVVRQGTVGPEGLQLIRVPNPMQSLHDMARWWRTQLPTTRVIAITGTAGKTTTKDMLATVLRLSQQVTASPRSFNNAIGVPLTVLSARADDAVLIAEVGINDIGEMAPLAALLEPDAAIVTRIGTGHLEGLRDCSTVAREKYQLIKALRPNGTAWVLHQPWPVPHGDFTVNTFGRDAEADWHLEAWGPGWFQLNGQRWPLGVLGRTAALNATVVVAAAKWAGVSDTTIARGLELAQASPQRMERRCIGGIEFIDDTWNANPDSMAASLETFGEVTASGRRWAILGDMLELGHNTASCHQDLAPHVLALHDRGLLDQLLLVGTHMDNLVHAIADTPLRSKTTYLPEFEPTHAASIAAQFQSGDLVLIKGSRGLAMERIIESAVFQAERPEQSMNQD